PLSRVLRLSLAQRESVDLSVAEPRAWADAVNEARQRAGTAIILQQQLELRGAQAADSRALTKLLLDERGFPAGFWHADAADDMRDLMRHTLAALARDVSSAAIERRSARLVP